MPNLSEVYESSLAEDFLMGGGGLPHHLKVAMYTKA